MWVEYRERKERELNERQMQRLKFETALKMAEIGAGMDSEMWRAYMGIEGAA